MVAMALLMGVVTVLVGFFGARIGAGIGRDLRGKIFGQVVRFSNAEVQDFLCRGAEISDKSVGFIF